MSVPMTRRAAWPPSRDFPWSALAVAALTTLYMLAVILFEQVNFIFSTLLPDLIRRYVGSGSFGGVLNGLLLAIADLVESSGQGLLGEISPQARLFSIAFGLAAFACAGLLFARRRWGFYGLAGLSLVALVTPLAIPLPWIVPLTWFVACVVASFTLPDALGRQISTDFYLRPGLALATLMGAPLLWLGVVYFGSLVALLINSFYYVEDFSGVLVRQFSLITYQRLFTAANLDIIERTAGMASAVTIACGVVAFPLAYYMARYAGPRGRAALYLAVLIPLWSSYLVRVYAWKLILAQEGIITWVFNQLGIGGALDFVLRLPVIGGDTLSSAPLGMWLVFVYVWLPYMILPIQAALERVPESVIEASGDLGARPLQTFWRVTLPLAFPGVVAGSIFTFSLTLGDYIIPGIIGDSSYFIGSAVLVHQGTAGNLPMAAAFTMVPMVIMAIYLTIARRLGAFDAL